MRSRTNSEGIDVFSVNQLENDDTLIVFVKLIDTWLMDALKREEKMTKSFFAMI